MEFKMAKQEVQKQQHFLIYPFFSVNQSGEFYEISEPPRQSLTTWINKREDRTFQTVEILILFPECCATPKASSHLSELLKRGGDS